MVTELNLFPPEDTLIRCKIPNSDKIIEVDAMEIDAMVGEAYARKQVSSMTVYELVKEVVDIFNDKYNYKMSHRSMDLLIMTKDKILTELKKNTLEQSEPVSSTT